MSSTNFRLVSHGFDVKCRYFSGRVLRSIFLIGAVLHLIIAFNVLSARAAKPAPPPPPPVKFQLSIAPATLGNIWDMNDSGTLVGQSRDDVSRHAIVVQGLQAIDLNEAFTPPEGWYFAAAHGINEEGSIVGWLGQSGVDINAVRRPFFIPADGWLTGSYTVLPFEMSPFVCGMDINDDGAVLVSFKNADGSFGAYTYETLVPGPAQMLPLPRSNALVALINNSAPGRPAQIAWETFDAQASGNRTYWRYTLGDADAEVWSFANSWFYPTGLNDAGSFCFGAIRQKSGNKSQYMAARYSDLFGYQTFADTTYTASDINNSGDMAIGGGALGVSPQLYSQGLGVLKLNDLLVGDPAQIQMFRAGQAFVPKLSERGAFNSATPNFPGLAGAFGAADGTPYFFMLVPVAP